MHNTNNDHSRRFFENNTKYYQALAEKGNQELVNKLIDVSRLNNSLKTQNELFKQLMSQMSKLKLVLNYYPKYIQRSSIHKLSSIMR